MALYIYVMLRLTLILVLSLAANLSFGQIPKQLYNSVTEEHYNPKDFTSKSKPIKQRLGVYHFGESEAEWDLLIMQCGDSLVIQERRGKWGNDPYTHKESWLLNCKTYNKVSVSGNHFYFGNNHGQFAEAKEGKTTTNTVLIYFGDDAADVGFYSTSIDTFFDGDDYSELSKAVQSDGYFATKTKQELKIMRNTIFARYGLMFQQGGEMEKHFRQKEWYRPHLKDVSHCLTQIEQKNLQAISRLEQL